MRIRTDEDSRRGWPLTNPGPRPALRVLSIWQEWESGLSIALSFSKRNKGKSDNHANAAFLHEGQELRDFLAPMKNTYVICGDRHWQYCSKDPKTGLIELGCGPINDQHQYGGNPGKAPMHRYFSAKGGFLGITIENGKAKAEWFTTNDVSPTNDTPKIGHTENL